MWDLPGPGLEPVSPALAGRFSTTAPPGKPLSAFLVGSSAGNILGLGNKLWAILIALKLDIKLILFILGEHNG